MSSEPYVPSVEEMKRGYMAPAVPFGPEMAKISAAEFDRFVAKVRADARCEAFQDAQQIIAGDHMVDESRERDADRVCVGRTIREIDVEIREAVVKLLRDAAHAIEQETSDGR